MKTFKEFVNESKSFALAAGEKEEAISSSITYLESELRRLYPEPEWKIRVSKSPLNGGVAIDFYNEKSARSGIARNSKTFMQFMIHLTGKFGNEEDLGVVSWEQISTSNYDIKFRKINSKKSVQDANVKLVKWFEKNKEAIYSAES